jgi:hypothetical protein
MTDNGKLSAGALREVVREALQMADLQGNRLVAAKLADVVDTIDAQQARAR